MEERGFTPEAAIAGENYMTLSMYSLVAMYDITLLIVVSRI